jgi:hypothetical protein
MVEDGVRIRISSEELSPSCDHLVLIIVVNSLMDFLRSSGLRGSGGVIGIGGLFWQPYFEVFLKSSKNSSSKYGRTSS